MSNLTEFPTEVIKELKYYVYRLIDPRNGETFYVGKGKGNRVFNHAKGVIDKNEGDDLSNKLLTIWEIRNSGLKVIHVIHRHGMDEKSALEVEAALIDAYPNATNAVVGSGSNDYGTMNVKQIIDKYSADEAEFKHKVLMITINKNATKMSVYDAVRFSWILSANKVKEVEYVLACIQGIIVGVFVPVEWKRALNANFPEFNHPDIPNRIGFVGHKADEEISKLYLRKRVPDKYRKRGAANPVKYNF